MDLKSLDEKAPQGAFSTFDAEILVPYVQSIPKGGRYVEIGVDKGKSLYIARSVAKPSVEVVGIDIRANPRVENTVFIRGNSLEIVKTWNRQIDVLFIDGDHSYRGCKADIDNWSPYLKKNGVMLYHDCDESSPGVVQAVAEYVNTHTVKKWELCKKTDKNTSMSVVEL